MRQRTIIGAMILAVAIGGGWWFTLGPAAAPPTGGCQTGTTGAAPLDGDGPEWRSITWGATTVVEPGRDTREAILFDVATLGAGFVGIGRRIEADGAWPAFSLRSTDGGSWTEPALEVDAARWRDMSIERLATVGDRVFALGSVSLDDRGGSRAAVWWTDDGAGWRESESAFGNVYLTGVAGDPGRGIIAVGGHGTVNGAWWSADGERWEALDLDLPVSVASAQWSDLTWSNGTWVGVGSISRSVDGTSAAVVWRSTDGRAWTCTVLDAGGRSVAAAHTVHLAGNRWLATGILADGCGWGASCGADRVAWISDDGVTWARVAPAPADGGGIDAAREGFVAVATDGAWASADGRTWHALDVPEPVAVAGSADAVAITDGGRIAIVGIAEDATGGAGTAARAVLAQLGR